MSRDTHLGCAVDDAVRVLPACDAGAVRVTLTSAGATVRAVPGVDAPYPMTDSYTGWLRGVEAAVRARLAGDCRVRVVGSHPVVAVPA